jgi:hypothetical protein
MRLGAAAEFRRFDTEGTEERRRKIEVRERQKLTAEAQRREAEILRPAADKGSGLRMTVPVALSLYRVVVLFHPVAGF